MLLDRALIRPPTVKLKTWLTESFIVRTSSAVLRRDTVVKGETRKCSSSREETLTRSRKLKPVIHQAKARDPRSLRMKSETTTTVRMMVRVARSGLPSRSETKPTAPDVMGAPVARSTSGRTRATARVSSMATMTCPTEASASFCLVRRSKMSLSLASMSRTGGLHPRPGVGLVHRTGANDGVRQVMVQPIFPSSRSRRRRQCSCASGTRKTAEGAAAARKRQLYATGEVARFPGLRVPVTPDQAIIGAPCHWNSRARRCACCPARGTASRCSGRTRPRAAPWPCRRRRERRPS